MFVDLREKRHEAKDQNEYADEDGGELFEKSIFFDQWVGLNERGCLVHECKPLFMLYS